MSTASWLCCGHGEEEQLHQSKGASFVCSQATGRSLERQSLDMGTVALPPVLPKPGSLVTSPAGPYGKGDRHQLMNRDCEPGVF